MISRNLIPYGVVLAVALALPAGAAAFPLSTVVFGQSYTRHAGTCTMTPTGVGALTITCADGQTERVNYRLAKVAGATVRVYFSGNATSVGVRSGRHGRTAIVRVGEGTTVIDRVTAYTA